MFSSRKRRRDCGVYNNGGESGSIASMDSERSQQKGSNSQEYDSGFELFQELCGIIKIIRYDIGSNIVGGALLFDIVEINESNEEYQQEKLLINNNEQFKNNMIGVLKKSLCNGHRSNP